MLYTLGESFRETINPEEDQPMKKIANVGVDYHLNSLSIAVLAEGEKEFHQSIHLKNDDRLIAKYLESYLKSSSSGFAMKPVAVAMIFKES